MFPFVCDVDAGVITVFRTSLPRVRKSIVGESEAEAAPDDLSDTRYLVSCTWRKGHRASQHRSLFREKAWNVQQPLQLVSEYLQAFSIVKTRLDGDSGGRS